MMTRTTDIVYSTRFSPDGRTLAIARGAAGTARVELWDVDSGTLRHTIGGFEGPVWSVSYAPDGQTLVTGSTEFHPSQLKPTRGRPEGKRAAELKWWDARTGELKQLVTMPGETQACLMAYYSLDGKLLATVEYQYDFLSFKADLKLLDARTGELRLKLKHGLTTFEFLSSEQGYPQFDPSYIMLGLRRQRMALSADGQLVAYWNTKQVRLWNSVTGAETVKLPDFKHNLRAVAFAPVGPTLAVALTTPSGSKKSATIASEIQLYDAATGALTQTVPSSTQVISCLAFPNQLQIMVGGWRNSANGPVATMELLDVQAGSLGVLRTGDTGSVNVITLSPDGRNMAFQSDLTSVNLVDTQTWAIKHTFQETNDNNTNQTAVSRYLLSVKRVLALGFSANGKTLAAGMEQGGVRLWDPRTGEAKNQFGDQDDAATVADVSSNGAVAAEAVDQTSIRLWNLGSSEKKIIATPGEPIAALALAPDGRSVAIGRADKIVLLNTAIPEQTRTLAGHGKEIRYLAFAPDGGTLAMASGDNTIQIWDLVSGQITRTMTGGRVTALRFAPGGRTLASASEDGNVILWDLQTGNSSLQPRKHSGAINAIAFSADGNLMATGGDDRTVIIWETATGKARHTLKGHDLAVTCLAFSPDGSLLATGAGNASVVLWDVPTGKLNRVLK